MQPVSLSRPTIQTSPCGQTPIPTPNVGILRAIDTTKNLCYIRNYANTQYALNIYRVNNNCDLFPFANNSADDCTIKCVDEGSSRFGIVLPAYALCLTPTGFTNGSNVNWQSSTGETKQLWRIFTNR